MAAVDRDSADMAQSRSPTETAPDRAETAPPAIGAQSAVHLSMWSRAAIRAIDIMCSLLGIVLLSFVMLPVAAAIRLTSPGPALFRQTRIGLRGRPFVMWKFRTMEQWNDDSEHRALIAAQLDGDAPADPSGLAHKRIDDPRVTPLGAYLRRFSVDELPQLFNVLAGKMSLVGPRPALPWEVEMFEPWHFLRFEAKPGITGLWQVSGRSYVSMRDALALDVDYVMHRSVRLDVAILLKTIPKVLTRHGAW